MKSFSLYICAYEFDLEAKIIDIMAKDEELAEEVAKFAIKEYWPYAKMSSYIVYERCINLEMLTPSDN